MNSASFIMEDVHCTDGRGELTGFAFAIQVGSSSAWCLLIRREFVFDDEFNMVGGLFEGLKGLS